jgi:hypothetical protein
VIGRQVDNLNQSWPFGDLVDEATSRGHATLQSSDTFKKLDLLLVLQGNILLASNDQLVAVLVSARTLARNDSGSHARIFEMISGVICSCPSDLRA